ncbi:hypothetical protein E5S69_31645 [Cupriavidus necator]|uniref:hypothetical protein n=1 Tax=Cupriavidus necator TaxID=106590 RepID=UPI00148F7352|nr:hypothetical protein [Cupriavidus necator]NOV28042.1 hypothetical protein [Cupriavidus necator]
MKAVPALAIAALTLAGCAISPEAARQLSSFEICDKMASPFTPASSVSVGIKELAERGENCSQFADIYAARQSARSANSASSAAMMGAGVAIMNQSRPVYAPPPQTIVIEQQAPPQPVRFTRPYP